MDIMGTQHSRYTFEKYAHRYEMKNYVQYARRKQNMEKLKILKLF